MFIEIWCESMSRSKIKNKVICKEEEKTHTLFHENIRALGWL